ncbi:hypothetical protein [Aequorivita lipolytica]|nr:hypothetical protein [Aequorivita lipolytica]
MSCKDGMWERPLFTSWVHLGYDYFIGNNTKAVRAKDTQFDFLKDLK